MRTLAVTILLLSTAQTEACQRWVEEFQQGPFRFHSEFPIKRGPIGRDLTQIKVELEATLKLKVGNEPIDVYLFGNARSYQREVQKRVPGAISRRALFVKADKGSSVYAYKNASFDIDLRHECTHALIHNSVQFIPLWMDEGMAEYFELKSGSRVRPTRLNDVKNAINWSRLTRSRSTLKRLESLNSIKQMGAGEYRDSWAWIHFLMHDRNNDSAGKKALIEYLAEIQKGNPPGAFSTFLEKRMPRTETKLVQHFRYFR
ncbi:MAG: DUF1570 domain-containing protein [Planctomycetaceae bacterium]